MDKVYAAGNHNLDWVWSILCGTKTDGRDMRPMMYHGRLVFPSPLDLSKNVWFNCEIRQTQRTTEVAQLSPKLTREVENMSEDALPLSTDSREQLAGAVKYWQVGAAACKAVINGVMTNSQPETIGPATLFLDLFVRNGEFAEAWAKQRPLRPGTFFLGFVEDQTEATYSFEGHAGRAVPFRNSASQRGENFVQYARRPPRRVACEAFVQCSGTLPFYSPHHCAGFLLLGLLPPTDHDCRADRPAHRPPTTLTRTRTHISTLTDTHSQTSLTRTRTHTHLSHAHTHLSHAHTYLR